jgi:importin-5
MVDTLPSLPQSHFPKLKSTLTPPATINSTLFQPHLRPLLAFLLAPMLPGADPGPIPTVAKLFPTSGSFTFLHTADTSKLPTVDDTDENSIAIDEEKEDIRKAALEFMISLSEAKPGMVRKVNSWVAAIVRGCLERLGELGDNNLDVWLEADVCPAEFFYLPM